MTERNFRWLAIATATSCLGLLLSALAIAEDKKDDAMVEVQLKLPAAVFVGTPTDAPKGTTVQKPTGKPRPPLMAPAGTANLALNKKVTASDPDPVVGKLEMATDGAKEGTDGSWVELGAGIQWLQVELEKEATIYGVCVWHYHKEARVYRDVIVQISNDPEFKNGVVTVFNNDQDDSAHLGIGKDYEYFDVAEGKLIDCKLTDPKGVKGRYVRCYSNGSTSDDQNHYTEVEVYGVTAK